VIDFRAAGGMRHGGSPAGGEKFMLTAFYTAFSPVCFALLSLWFVVITINARTWLNSQQQKQQKQAYAVALYFAAPGTMSLLALIDPQSTFAWRVFFIIVSVAGAAGLFLFGSLRDRRPHDPLDTSDHVVYWLAIGLYLAIAVLAFTPLHTLQVEGVLLTVLMLLGVHVALRLMFAVGVPAPETAETAPADTTPAAT
jgi:hypothetical protein